VTERELRKLSRADLLQMLIDQSEQLHALRRRLEEMEASRQDKTIAMEQAGSIAEAALKISGMFENTQAACEQYTDSVRLLCEKQEARSIQREQESVRQAQQILAEAELKAKQLQQQTQAQCEAMLRDASRQCRQILAGAELSAKTYPGRVYANTAGRQGTDAGLQELLAIALAKKGQ